MLGVLIGGIVFGNLILGLTVFVKNPKARINQGFLFISLALAIWSGANYMADLPLNPLLWTRVTFFGAALVAVSFSLFSYVFPRTHLTNSVIWMLLGGLPGILVAFMPLLVVGVTPRATDVFGGGFDPVRGPLYPFFGLYFSVYMLLGIIRIYRKLRTLNTLERIQTKYYFVGIVMATITGFITNVLLPLLTHSSAFAKFSSLATLMFAGFASYAIIKHRLLNINFLVARSVAYTLLLITIAGVYGLALFTVTAVFFPDSPTSAMQNVTFVVLAVVLAFTFHPIRAFLEEITSDIFYRDGYDSEEVLSDFGRVMVAEAQLEKLLQVTLKQITAQLKVTYGQYFIYDDKKLTKVEHVGPAPDVLVTAAELAHFRHAITVADELESGMVKRTMMQHGIRVVVRLRTKDELVGYLVLGEKLGGDIYSDQDIQMLEILGSELAVAISNALAYEEIARFNETLQERVEIATRRLREANSHLKELDRAKDEFISMASHQLRTPLTTIKGYLSMLDEGDAGKLTREQRQFVQLAYGGSERMVSLISDLLNVSRMSAGKFEIERRPTDLSALAAEEVQQLQQHATAKNLKLQYEPPTKALPLLSIDETKTRQVIMNFIDNAIYYTTSGSVTVKLRQTDGQAELLVVDTGIGVPPDAQKQLFTKFYRAGNAQKVRPDGTGLGLFLAKRVIEDQGGTIIFRSEEGHGSTFGFKLPLTVQNPTHASPRPPKKQLVRSARS